MSENPPPKAAEEPTKEQAPSARNTENIDTTFKYSNEKIPIFTQDLFQEFLQARDNLRHSPPDPKESWRDRILTVLALCSLILLGYGITEIFAPSIVELATQNSTVQFSLLGSLLLFIIFILFSPDKKKIDESFIGIDNTFATERFDRQLYQTFSTIAGENTPQTSIENEKTTKDDTISAAPAAADSDNRSRNSEFETYLRDLVNSIDQQIAISDTKASRLLDTGTKYLRRGLYFYIGSILFWQVLGHFSSFTPLIVVGIASCSIAFIVIEFLAAWFLKQYRSYVDSSIAYMRARSTFNRYLLSYYSIKEFCSETGEQAIARSEMLKVLTEEVKWPRLKDIQANDFNYMIESMGALNSSMEKMRGLFSKDTPKAKT